MTTAVLVLSRRGLALARAIRAEFGQDVTIFGPACVVGCCAAKPKPNPGKTHGPNLPPGAITTGEPGELAWQGPLRLFFPGVWNSFENIVAVMALGIAVRLAAPLLGDKRRDPALVVVDEAGRFAISALGGHEAGANALARRLAETLKAQAVITTASESLALPAASLIGRDLGWKIERAQNLTRVGAAIVRGETVAVWQDAGTRDWWRPFGPWPRHFVALERLEDWHRLNPAALLAITDQVLTEPVPEDRTVVYRPPSLVAGIGCRRGVTAETIEAVVQWVFSAYRLVEQSLAAVATVSLKAKEPGLVEFAARRELPLLVYSLEELAAQVGVQNPSARVKAKIGIAAVAEPAALKAAGVTRLLVPKEIGAGVTLAIAQKPSSA